jgi:hypothetical protein
VNLKYKARLTHIATQGFYGSTSKWIKSYKLQYSDNGNLWTTYAIKNTIQVFDGNTDPTAINKVELQVPLLARYIRIRPITYENGICLRMELYGCYLEKAEPKSTEAPREQRQLVDRTFKGKFRLKNLDYDSSYADHSSSVFKKLSDDLNKAIIDAHIVKNADNTFSLAEGFKEFKVVQFMSGSVIVSWSMRFHTATANPTQLLQKKVQSGKIGKYDTDPNSFESVEVVLTETAPQTQESVSGMTNGEKVGLLVFFVLTIVVMLVGGAVYYFRRRRHYDMYLHKDFQNPTHIPSASDDNIQGAGGDDLGDDFGSQEGFADKMKL